MTLLWCGILIYATLAIVESVRAYASDEPLYCVQHDCFRCHNRRCLSQSFVCNGEDDCGDNSGEANCHDHPNLIMDISCSTERFQCTDKTCISLQDFCDKKHDCPDQSDEYVGCMKKKKCNDFQCKNGYCVKKQWVCDGFDDCLGYSDESNWANRTIPSEQCNNQINRFLCEHGRCISINDTCATEKTIAVIIPTRTRSHVKLELDTKVGRIPKVPEEEMIKLIEKYIDHFTTNDIPPLGDRVWMQMSQDVDNRIKARSVYTHVRSDKRYDLTKARKNQGIVVSPKSKPYLIEEVPKSDDEESCDSDMDDNYIPESLHDEQKLETFNLLISNEEWTLIKPDDTTKKLERRLKQKTWATVITNAFWKRYNFSCAFLAKWSYVCVDFDPQKNEYFLKFVAYCKDQKDCKNFMIGMADEKPSNKGLRLTIKTRDTRGEYHKEVKRPLNYFDRKQAGSELEKQSAAHYRDQLLLNHMEFGEDIPYFIQENNIYRQVKMEMNKEKAGLKPKEKLDVIKCLQKMATDPRYVNNIHDVGSIRFYVWYCTQEQLHVFKEYVRVLKDSSQIAIDATGRVIKKFEICPGKKTGHIFLYTVTINFESKTICVYQMVTEIHTQEFLENWLKFWVRLGAPAPGEALSDYERAIPMSCCLAFNNMNLKDYVDACFVWATNEQQKKPRPPKTLIRIDVAHLMCLVSKWKCLIHKDHPYIKHFFIRCIALMVDAQSVQEFQRIFLLTCIVALQPYEDSIISTSTIKTTVLDARKELEKSMSVRKATIENLEASMNCYQETKRDATPLFDEGDNGTLTHQFIKKLIASAKTADSEASKMSVNAFYLPDFARELERIGKEFPLWSAAAIPGDGEHASTAYQEGYYANMRGQIFQFTQLPCSAPRFVIEHLDSLKSGSNLLAAKLKHFNHQQKHLSPLSRKNKTLHDDIDENGNVIHPPKRNHLTDDSDVLAYEKWGGLENEQVFIVENENSDNELTTENNIATEKEQFSIHDTSFILSDILDYEAVKNDIVDQNRNSVGNEIVDCRVIEENFSICTEDHFAVPVSDSSAHTKLNHEASNNSHLQSHDVSFMHPGFTSTPMHDHSYSLLMVSDEKVSQFIGDCNEKPDQKVDRETSKNSSNDKKDVNHNLPSFELNSPIDECNQKAKQKPIISVKTKIKKNIEPKGFYFQSRPEIKILNERKSSRRQGFLLVNGLISNLIKIKCSQFSWNYDLEESEKRKVQYKDIKVLVRNTCGFDAIVHIIQFSALDNPTYNSFVENSTNNTLQFVANFLKKGLSERICYERLKILNEFYPIKRNGNLTSLSPYEIDAEDFITRLWTNLFSTEPSRCNTYQCSNLHCVGKPTENLSFLPINEKIIKINSYRALQTAVLYDAHVHHSKCQQPGCTGVITEKSELNIQIYIELDVRESREMKEPMECSLQDFPINLELGKKYRLAGIIHYHARHFIAYCLRASGSWLCCNDLQRKIESAKKTTVVKPHAAIYVLE